MSSRAAHLQRVYTYCSAEHEAFAKRAKILEFLDNEQKLKDDLMGLALDAYRLFKARLDERCDVCKLVAKLMSTVFGENARQDLKDKFTDHILREQVDDTPKCFEALGPVIVGLLFAEGKLDNAGPAEVTVDEV